MELRNGKLQRVWKYFIVFLLGSIVTLFIIVILNWSSREEISVQYAPNDLYLYFDYSAVLYKEECFLCSSTHKIWIGKTNGKGEYGHWIEIPPGWVTEQFTTRWTKKGVWLHFTNGGQIWVPAASFTGGR